MKKNFKERVALAVLLFPILLYATFAFGQEIQLPRLSIDELKAMLDRESEVVVLDTQPKKLYDLGHIKGAVSFPFKTRLDWADVGQLPGNKPIVIYCDCGPGEADSNFMGLKLREMGFFEIKVLAAPSIRGWIEKGYPVEK